MRLKNFLCEYLLSFVALLLHFDIFVNKYMLSEKGFEVSLFRES